MITCSKCGLSAQINDTLHCGRCGTTTPCNQQSQTIGKVGKTLLSVIPGVFKKKGCGCEEYAAEIDRHTIEWAIEHRDEIVENILTRAKKRFKVLPPFSERLISHWVDVATGKLMDPVKESPYWYVAVTTAPRTESTLLSCVSSLRYAGWEPIVFAEPGSVETNCVTVTHDRTLGVWHNWLVAARAGIESGKLFVMTVQDDTAFHPDSMLFAGRHIEHTDGFLSLYTPSHYSYGRSVGVNHIRTKSLWGACAIVWRRDLLAKVLETKVCQSWMGARLKTKSAEARVFARRRANPALIANSDTAIGKAMKELGKRMFFVDPSPATHIARFSTGGRGDNTNKRNCGRCADHFKPLVKQVFPNRVEAAAKVKALARQYPPIDVLVTTSLSHNRIARQQVCLRTWQKLGAKLLAIQVEGDVEKLRPHFPDLEFKEVPRKHHKYSRVLISDHMRESQDRGVPTIMTNSDIEIYYDQQSFKKLFVDVADKTLVFGSRWDHYDDIEEATKIPNGIDVFRFTPEMLSVTGDAGFCIGNCVWDYWLPYSLYLAGYKLRSDPHPRLLHKVHVSGWTPDDHAEGSAAMKQKFGLDKEALHLEIKRLKRVAEANVNDVYPRSKWIQQRIIFEHVPKCGGQSLKQAIRPRVRSRISDPVMQDIVKRQDINELEQQVFIHGHFLHQVKKMPSGIRVTNLREPLSRVVSLYKYIRNKPTHDDYDVARTTHITDCHRISREFRNGMTWQLSQLSHGEVMNAPERAVEAAMARLREYDIVFSVPRLDIAQRELNRRLGLSEPIYLGWINSSKESWGLDDLDDSALDSIRVHNQADTMLWNRAADEFGLR